MFILLSILVFLSIAVVAYAVIRERKRMRKKTVESVGHELWKEIEREREVEIERGKLFRDILKKKEREKK